jgi:glycerophosphoryl diester phosphodiesterase
MPSAKIERQIRPLVVAHRGASAVYPENTLEAFLGAVEAGADLVELDVRLTADGVAVVLHDLDVSATTDGSGMVHQLTLAEVKRLDASGGRGPRVEVPTLREALHALSGLVGVNVEVKNLPGEPAFDSPREAAAEEVVRLLDEVGFSGPVLVSSFNWLSIERVQQMDGAVPTGFLTTAMIDPRAALFYVRSREHQYVLPQAPALLVAGAVFVEEAHRKGVRVGTWTVDDPSTIEELYGMGVDAIATNDPAMAIPIRDRFCVTGKGAGA